MPAPVVCFVSLTARAPSVWNSLFSPQQHWPVGPWASGWDQRKKSQHLTCCLAASWARPDQTQLAHHSVAPAVLAVHVPRTLEKCMDPTGRAGRGMGSAGPLLLPFLRSYKDLSHFEAATPQKPHPGPQVLGVSGGAACAFLVLCEEAQAQACLCVIGAPWGEASSSVTALVDCSGPECLLVTSALGTECSTSCSSFRGRVSGSWWRQAGLQLMCLFRKVNNGQLANKASLWGGGK